MKLPVLINGTYTVKKAKNIMKKHKSNILCITEGNEIKGYVNYKDIKEMPDSTPIVNLSKPCSLSVIKKSPMNLIIKLIEDKNTLFVIEKGVFLGVISKDTLKSDGFIQ